MHSWIESGCTSEILQTLESWQGMVSGLIACTHCEAVALLRLLAWQGQTLDQRVFSIGQLSKDSAALYLRALGNATCDLSRGTAEFEALVNLAQIDGIGRFTLSPLTCRGFVQTHAPVQHLPWQDMPTDPEEYQSGGHISRTERM